MFKYFFYQEDWLPEGVGFKLFGAGHLIYLAVFLILGFIICNLYKKADMRKRDIYRKTICFTTVGLEILRAIFLIVIGKYSYQYLPLHLCDWTIFLSMYQVFKPNKVVADILYSLCMPGAMIALLFCAWHNYPMMNFMCIHSFVVHWLMVLFVMVQLIGGEIKISIEGIKYTVLFAVLVSIPTYVFNYFYGTNFWFLNKVSLGSPLAFFANKFGYVGYLISIFCVFFTVVFLMHLPCLYARERQTKELKNVG